MLPYRAVRVLAVDVGSSSVKAAVLAGGRIASPISHQPVANRVAPPCVEVPAEPLWAAVGRAIRGLGGARRGVERIALSALSPSCTLLDRRGDPLTPLITHQDRRSVAEALWLESHFGRREHLLLAGNRPYPGGIGSTTLLWLKRNAPGVLRRAATVGMGTTFLVNRLTGERTIDPGNAGFLGLYDHRARARGGSPSWSRELSSPAGIRPSQLPAILDGGAVAGHLQPRPARALGLQAGIEVLVGVVDTSAAFLGAGAVPGRLINVIGTTDVIALASSRPRPHSRILTRELGTGPLWLSVYTIACGGGSLEWAHRALFPDLGQRAFYRLAKRLAGAPVPRVGFRPYLAGDRMSIRQREAGFDGLDLNTTREELLRAVLAALSRWNAEGMALLTRRARPLPEVSVTGGGEWLGDLLHRAWPGRWRFRRLKDAAFQGLRRLAEGEGGAREAARGARREAS